MLVVCAFVVGCACVCIVVGVLGCVILGRILAWLYVCVSVCWHVRVRVCVLVRQ